MSKKPVNYYLSFEMSRMVAESLTHAAAKIPCYPLRIPYSSEKFP